MNILSAVIKNFKLSPTYCTSAVLATGILGVDLKQHKRLTVEAVSAGIFLAFPSFIIWTNYHNYQKAKCLMQRYGYKDRLFKVFTKTFCRRQQVKLAAHELGLEQLQKLHFKKSDVRWYHFDSTSTANFILPAFELCNICNLSSVLYRKIYA